MRIKRFNKIAVLILIIIILTFLAYQLKDLDIKNIYGNPNFTVKINECRFDGIEEGILSFSFNMTVKEKPTRVPSQIIFQIIDVYKNYSFHKYKFFHGVNLTREYKLEKVYQPEETLNNVSFVIGNVYKDYMYLPSEYFNYQLYYCQFDDGQLNYLKESKKIFEVLDQECVLFFDFEHYYKDHIYALLSHPGRQCAVIPRVKT
jgi:hypothetical protein